MKLVFWPAALGLLMAAPACAAPEAVSFQVQPGDARVVDVETGQEVARATPGPVGHMAFTAETATPHHYRLVREPFDSVDMTVAWDPEGGWRLRSAQQVGTLSPSTVLWLPRTVALNVSPPDTATCIATSDGSGQEVEVSGVRHRVVPLLRNGGQVMIPHGWSPPSIFLLRPGFVPQVLDIPAGSLDTATSVYPTSPIRLTPVYGPFSYPAFNAGLALVVVVSAGVAWRRRANVPLPPPPPAVPAQGDSLVGQTVTTAQGQQYRLTRLIGQGAMGHVLEAHGSSSPVAVKIVSPADWNKPEWRQRFEREIRICCTLSHPAIVKVIDWGLWHGDSGVTTGFMVMELLSGQTLRAVLAAHQPLPAAQVTAWLEEALQGLRTAHAAGIVHRDIKPENIMISPSGRLKLLDFGVAADRAADTLTRTNAALGTLIYMSPEHFNARQAVPASDLYSLGMVAYEMATGRPAHGLDDGDWAVLGRVIMAPVPDVRMVNPEVPDRLGTVIMKLIERDLAIRYASADAVLADLA